MDSSIGKSRSTQTASAPPRILSCAFALLLAFALALSSLAGVPLPAASASGSSVTMWKVGNIEYTDGAWNAHIFRVDDGEGEAVAYCVEPSKNSPPEGRYEKAPFVLETGREPEMRSALWFGYGGPGFDASMWPSTNWDGAPISADDYYLATHILLSDDYCSNLYEACYGAGTNFRNWIEQYVTGLDMDNGDILNPNALGRVAVARLGEIPSDFETYLIDGGWYQTLAASSAYHPNGTIKMNKRSANRIITDGNPNYTLKGISYRIYTDPKCDAASDTGRSIVLDEGGFGQVTEVPMGDYYIREVESSVAGTGYAYDPTVYSCKVLSGKDSWVHDTANEAGDVDQNDVTDEPQTRTVDILIQKHDMITHSSTPSSDGVMADALFEVRFFANADGSTSGNATRTWRFKTDSEGRVDLRATSPSNFVSGDALYRDAVSGEALFPLGTYEIRELSAPSGYGLHGDGSPVTLRITSAGTGRHDVSSGALAAGGVVVDQAPVRHDLSFAKRDMDTQRPMAGIPFMITRMKADGSIVERHVIVTDANGIFDSSASHASHATRTNANDAAVTTRADGSRVVDEDRLDADAGVWFGVASDGSWASPDDSLGAFPDSTSQKYVFEELPVKANEGKALVRFEAYAHAARPSEIDLGTVGNTTPTLVTTAHDKRDGDKLVSKDFDAVVVDAVSYTGLVAGNSYTIRGRIIDAESGRDLVDSDGKPVTSSITFAAPASSGSVELDFSFDASRLDDGMRLVVCEELYEGDRLLASHDDLDDGAQTVMVSQPSLATQAVDGRDGDMMLVGDVDARIVDHVSYTGLASGVEYTLTGTLMDKATGRPFQSPAGPVTSSVSFTTEGSTGSVDVTFSFDAAELEPGTQLVVFEKLTRNGVDIASHEDIEDIGQTVSVFPPTIRTSASDPDDGDNVIGAGIETMLVDTVSFEGLVPGREYVLEGTLMDKSTGRPLLDPFERPITATRAFTPLHESGSTELGFVFDAANVDGSVTCVVFEELYREGRHLASHADIESAAQTVVVEQPYLRTSASTDGSSKSVMRAQDVRIIDVVTYHNLKPGVSYELVGTIMNKANGAELLDRDGNPFVQSMEFVAEESSGHVELPFVLDTTRLESGDQLVVFEKLFREGVELASHESIDDVQQTITVENPRIATTARSYDGGKEVVRDAEVRIVDTVNYENLVPSRDYVLVGTVMDKTSGQPLLNQTGEEVMSSTRFAPDHGSGSVDLSFTFDASALSEGSELVVFERLLHDDVEIATHEDLDDPGQTVTLVAPAIETMASDPLDGDKLVSAREHTRVVDMVSYRGLQPGAEYLFVGTLMDKETLAPLLTAQGLPAQSTKAFTADAPEGTVEVPFSFDASDSTQEREAVIFQELYRGDNLIATHADYDNAAQTVTVTPASIETHATNEAEDGKEIKRGGKASIVDTVSFTGLVPGETYELDGTLMIDDGTLEGRVARDVFGNPISAHASFVAEASHGDTKLGFEIDTSILDEGTKIVVFEKLFHERTLMASHEDIRDESQTVYIGSDTPVAPEAPGMPFTLQSTERKSPTPSVPTGDSTMLIVMACGIIGTAAFALLAILRRKAFGERFERK